jgi:addiction module HigA family antidote
MVKKVYKKTERKPSHPGEILKSGFIEQFGLRIETVAALLGITRIHLSRILNGHKPITIQTAIRLEIITQTPASQWLALQSEYDEYMIKKEISFQKYEKLVGEWISNSLTMEPKKRRADKTTQSLVERAAKAAKRLEQKVA